MTAAQSGLHVLLVVWAIISIWIIMKYHDRLTALKDEVDAWAEGYGDLEADYNTLQEQCDNLESRLSGLDHEVDEPQEEFDNHDNND